MARSRTVGLVFESWNDLDRVLANLNTDEATQRLGGGSSFAWTLAHVTSMVDAWVNVRFQGRPAHPLISQQRFGLGSPGIADDWAAIKAAAVEVRNAARECLQELAEDELDLAIPYDGSMLHLRESGLSLRYALLRICAHHYVHIGEVATKRAQLGQAVGDYPGTLTECI